MNYDNGFELTIAVVFYMRPQLGGLGPKYQDVVILFCLGEGESLLYFHFRALSIISELVLARYQTGDINNLTGK